MPRKSEMGRAADWAILASTLAPQYIGAIFPMTMLSILVGGMVLHYRIAGRIDPARRAVRGS